ncbi:MAG: hypothetical protein JWL65_1415 [Gammaproteobacteria bacterium]|nr:hypothetical protein [Gammaproteobacteria bacterium]
MTFDISHAAVRVVRHLPVPLQKPARCIGRGVRSFGFCAHLACPRAVFGIRGMLQLSARAYVSAHRMRDSTNLRSRHRAGTVTIAYISLVTRPGSAAGALQAVDTPNLCEWSRLRSCLIWRQSGPETYSLFSVRLRPRRQLLGRAALCIEAVVDRGAQPPGRRQSRPYSVPQPAARRLRPTH